MNFLCNFFLGVLLLSSNVFVLNAQDLDSFKESLIKSSSYYKVKNDYVLEVDYSFYKDKNQSIPDEIMQGSMVRKGSDFYYKVDQTEFIFTQGDFVKVNHQEKALLYTRSSSTPSQVSDPLQIEGLVNICKDVTQIKDGDLEIFDLSFHPQLGIPYKRVRIILDSTSHAILEQEIYFFEGRAYPWHKLGDKISATPGKIVIKLKETSMSADNSLFKISNYINKGAKVSLSEKLKGYTLFNTTK